jgi:histidinol-phosphate aminotransferase
VGDEVLYVRYGFSVYPIAARRVGAVPVEAPDSDYATDVDKLLAAVTERTRVVFVANPNNPTGTYTSKAEIARLHAACPTDCLLVLDQAYTEYLDPADEDGALELARTKPNVLVTRTFSKIFGLAAGRIGWGYGPIEVIDAMQRIRAPFNVATAGQDAAIAALKDQDFLASSKAHNDRWRGWFESEIAGARQCRAARGAEQGQFHARIVRGRADRRDGL